MDTNAIWVGFACFAMMQGCVTPLQSLNNRAVVHSGTHVQSAITVDDLCHIATAVGWDRSVYLLVASGNGSRRSTCCVLRDGTVNFWRGTLDFQQIVAVGRSESRKPLIALMNEVSGKTSTTSPHVTVLQAEDGGTKWTLQRKIILEPGERFVAFADSAPEVTFSESHIFGNPNEQPVRMTGVPIKAPFLVDVSGDTALIAWPATIIYNTFKSSGAMVQCNLRTGECQPVNAGNGFDPERQRISGIVADPKLPGAFYIALQNLWHTGGGLWWRSPGGEFKLIYKGELTNENAVPELGCLGERLNRVSPHDDPVHSVKIDNAGNVTVLTGQGVKQVRDGQVVELFRPKFRRVGGVFVSESESGVVCVCKCAMVILSNSTCKLLGGHLAFVEPVQSPD